MLDDVGSRGLDRHALDGEHRFSSRVEGVEHERTAAVRVALERKRVTLLAPQHQSRCRIEGQRERDDAVIAVDATRVDDEAAELDG